MSDMERRISRLEAPLQPDGERLREARGLVGLCLDLGTHLPGPRPSEAEAEAMARKWAADPDRPATVGELLAELGRMDTAGQEVSHEPA